MTGSDEGMDPAEHAARFDEKAGQYDDDASEEYREAVALVVGHARAALREGDVVLDLGTGTGALALRLASDAARVVARDPSEGMLERAVEKAAEREVVNVEFAHGRFREPRYEGSAGVVVSNYAMHHLDDAAKREAIDVVAEYGPRRFVLGDVMLFGEPDPSSPSFDPGVDDPATVGVLVDALTDAGFAVTAAHAVTDQVGVLVADQPYAVPELAEADAAVDRGTGEDAAAGRNADEDAGDAGREGG